jgi:hypothetical protein
MSTLIKNEGHILKAKTKGCISSVLKAECYVLEDGTPIIRGRGYIRSLIGVDSNHNQSGQRFSRMISNNNIRQIIPQEIIYKLENPVIFKDLNDKQIEGFDARTLPLFAFHLWEAFLQGKINEGHTYYNEATQAGNVVKAFATKGIDSHIYEITGYNQIKGVVDLLNHFNQYVQDIPNELKREFENAGIFDELYRIYNIKRNMEKSWQHPQFFGHIFNKYIYWPLDLQYTKDKIETKGIIKHLLSTRKNAGQTLYAFIKESGQPTFFRHFGAIMQIMKNSKNPKDLERNFYIDFPLCIPSSTLALFPNDFVDVVKNVDFMLKEKNVSKKLKIQNNNYSSNADLFNTEESKSIQSIAKENPQLATEQNNDFEKAIDKILKIKPD